MTIHIILYILAIVCFLLAAFNVPRDGRVFMGWIGAALVVLTLLV